MPGTSRGFHFWQPAPILNNTVMAGKSPQPSHEPPCKETDTVTLKYQWKEGGKGGGGEPAEETSWLTTLAEKHSFNTLPETYPTLMMLTTTNSECASRPTTDH